jgi:hypothetical protein
VQGKVKNKCRRRFAPRVSKKAENDLVYAYGCFCERLFSAFSLEKEGAREKARKKRAPKGAFARCDERRGYAPRLRRLLKKAGENFWRVSHSNSPINQNLKAVQKKPPTHVGGLEIRKILCKLGLIDGGDGNNHVVKRAQDTIGVKLND